MTLPLGANTTRTEAEPVTAPLHPFAALAAAESAVVAAPLLKSRPPPPVSVAVGAALALVVGAAEALVLALAEGVALAFVPGPGPGPVPVCVLGSFDATAVDAVGAPDEAGGSVALGALDDVVLGAPVTVMAGAVVAPVEITPVSPEPEPLPPPRANTAPTPPITATAATMPMMSPVLLFCGGAIDCPYAGAPICCPICGIA